MPDQEALSHPNELLAKLATALTLISRGDPLVSLRTELETRFEGVDTRFDAIDRATELQHQDLVRVPTQVDRAVGALKDLLIAELQAAISETTGVINTNAANTREKFNGAIEVVNEKITSLANVTTQQFKSIDDKFAEKDKAVSVGLSAQKESAAAQQDSNNTATRKMEDNFTKLLDQGRELLTEVRRNTELQINDIKSRLDKGEGRTSFTDPDTTSRLDRLTGQLTTLIANSHEGVGRAAAQKDYSSTLIALAAVVVAIISFVWRPTPAPVYTTNGSPTLQRQVDPGACGYHVPLSSMAVTTQPQKSPYAIHHSST
jgi:hypothetical protein